MTVLATKPARETGHRVNVMLTSARVIPAFRDALFEASSRERISPSEFALKAAAEKLASAGHAIPGVFALGDLQS